MRYKEQIRRRQRKEIKIQKYKYNTIEKILPFQAREAPRWCRFFSKRQGRMVGPDGDDGNDGDDDDDGDDQDMTHIMMTMTMRSI